MCIRDSLYINKLKKEDFYSASNCKLITKTVGDKIQYSWECDKKQTTTTTTKKPKYVFTQSTTAGKTKIGINEAV